MSVDAKPPLHKVLIIKPPPAFTIHESEFSQHFHFIKASDSPLPLPNFLAAANSAGITALLASGHVPLNARDVFDYIPNLRCIVTTTAGLNQIDLPECRRRGIAVASAGDSYSVDCADHAVALLIDVLRKVTAGDGFLRRGGWTDKREYCLGNRAYDSPLSLPEYLAATNSSGVTAMLIGGHVPITAADVLDHLPNLRLLVITIIAGLNHIDLEESGHRGIAVSYADDAYSDDCADFAVALFINHLHKVSAGDRFVRRGDWCSTDGLYCLGHRLKGKKIGVVGLGSIGCRIAKRLEALGCKILYNSRKEKPSVSYPYYSDIHELAANSDALVLSCALTDETRHMINKEVLTALGKEGVIINIARGPIIDENELVRFLVEGKIAGAGLDVFEKEPNVPKELLAMDNVVLSPHAAYLTHESFRDVFEFAKGNLQAFFSNKPLLSPVMDG
uniref:Uncharacterized protein n=1 Tax=Chenopodium quinoa TaxID=63459 RepID=A0A803KZ08_CHEQI